MNYNNLSNYPDGVSDNTPGAPWNSPEDLDPVEVDCCVSYSLSKTVPVWIENYYITEESEADIDDEGRGYCHSWTEKHFEETDFTEEFNKDPEAFGIPDLLKELQDLAKGKIKTLSAKLKEMDLPKGSTEGRDIQRELTHYRAVLDASQGWTVDDLYVEQD